MMCQQSHLYLMMTIAEQKVVIAQNNSTDCVTDDSGKCKGKRAKKRRRSATQKKYRSD